MSLPNELLPVGLLGTGAVDTEYQIERSLRFNSADSAYLSRTPASAGNRKTWTWAGWVKGTLDKRIFSAGIDAADDFAFGFQGNGYLDCFNRTSGVLNARLISTSFYRDPSAWYHFVCVWNSSSATASDRFQIWVNGNRLTDFSTATYPTQNLDCIWNNTTTHYIGSQTSILFFSGYLADVHFIDGQALDPTSFGEFDTNNIWQPKAYSGTYPGNSFHLDFADNSSAAALGYDAAGSNDWTVNNLSVTAGAGNDSLTDSPTNYGIDTGAGAEVRGNYCTLNPLITTSSTLSNGNLDYASTATYQSAFSTIGVRTGKWYFEGTVGTFASDAVIGVGYAPFTTSTYIGGSSTSWGYEGFVGRIYNNGSFSAFGSTYGAGDVIGVAFDADTGKLWFAKNGTWQASGSPATGVNPAVTLTTGIDYFFGVSAGNTGTWVCNWGARPFAYPAPSGFKALCTTNLPEPTIKDGSTAMDVKTWTGNGGTQTITLGFSPDLVWVKNRSGTTWNTLVDSVRGTPRELYSNATNAEVTSPTASNITNFTSTGFDVAPGSVDASAVNASGSSYVGWAWDAGSSTVTNTAGSITSQVRANPSAGFSIVSYTSVSGTQTVGHGLNVAPKLIITKNRSGAYNWWTFTTLIDGSVDYLSLNTTNAAANDTTGLAAPTSSVFSVNANGYDIAGSNMIAYCFAPVEGYSAFGSYTGNDSADGPFVFCNFRPTFVMLKYSSGAGGNWVIYDNKRGAINLNSKKLAPNLAGLENDGSTLGNDSVGIDFLSNGFKIRTTGLNHNVSAGTYIYAAFAESPFALARAR